MARRDVWLETAEQARGAVRLLLMVDRVGSTPAVRALGRINLIGDRPHQLDECVMELIKECDGLTGELHKQGAETEPEDDIAGSHLL